MEAGDKWFCRRNGGGDWLLEVVGGRGFAEVEGFFEVADLQWRRRGRLVSGWVSE